MSEISLRVQIAQIDQLLSYIGKTCQMVNKLDQGIEDRLKYISQSGMCTETAEKMQNEHMRVIKEKIDSLYEILHEEERYLREKKEDLERVYNNWW